MAKEAKYFQSKVKNFVSNGKVSFRFSREVVRVEDADYIKILSSAKSVTELTEEEARKVAPDLFLHEEGEKKDNEGGDDAEKTKSKLEYEQEALALGATEKELKGLKKDEIIELVEKLKKAKA